MRGKHHDQYVGVRTRTSYHQPECFREEGTVLLVPGGDLLLRLAINNLQLEHLGPLFGLVGRASVPLPVPRSF